jgi:queuine tRNA-ribosyltransferase
MAFEVTVGGSGPRTGRLTLPSGSTIQTPLFMPVATKLSVKAVDPAQLLRTGTEVVITNGFLSHLEPGTDAIRSHGGMARMMGWKGGVFSDSGGFQFIRKGFDAKVSDEGVHLRSPYTGEKVFLTPETVMDFHVGHGVDVGMVLDHCPPFPSSLDGLIGSAQRTVHWARRTMEHYFGIDGSLSPTGRLPLVFGITQGGIDPDLRRDCTKKLVDLDMDGYGIGGLSIGESKEDTFRALSVSTRMLPVDRPRYFMGVGDPGDLIRSVLAGVDVFDSVFPTRNARHRNLFTPEGRENVRGLSWRGSEAPIFEGCPCTTCKRFSRGYLHHLFKAQEPLAATLASIHNITFMQLLVKGIHVLIGERSFDDSTGIPDCIMASLSVQDRSLTFG